MYKTSFAILLLAVACSAIPLTWEENLDVEDQYDPAPRADRHARATCDLLSISAGGFAVNHAACATHCLVNGRGNSGGRCMDGVCICRK